MPIVTLIAAGNLDARLVSTVRDTLGPAGEARWIDGGDAADLHVEGEAADIRQRLRAFEDRIDIIVQEADARTPVGLFVADMDSTMIGQECIDELADYAGFKPEVAAITERAMQGELDFAAALAERVALLAWLERKVVARCLAERVVPNPGADILLRTLKAHGVHSLLVSGGFTDFVAPIAERLGFDGYRANVLEADGERLTGRTVGEIVDSTVKRTTLEETRGTLGLDARATMAVGDGANDAAMVTHAGIGIGYHPKPALAEVASGSIRYHDLSALLWVAGIPKARWAA